MRSRSLFCFLQRMWVALCIFMCVCVYENSTCWYHLIIRCPWLLHFAALPLPISPYSYLCFSPLLKRCLWYFNPWIFACHQCIECYLQYTECLCGTFTEEIAGCVLTPRWQHPVQRVLLSGTVPGFCSGLPVCKFYCLGLGPDTWGK